MEIDYSKYAFEEGTYKPFAVCVPVGFGIRKSFHSMAGIKLEAGFRFTSTDYIDDVSTRYFDPVLLEQQRGKDAVTMSGVNSGNTFVLYKIWRLGPPQVGTMRHYRLESDHSPAPYLMEKALLSLLLEYISRTNKRQSYNLDSYMFLTLSAYKKFKNTQII